MTTTTEYNKLLTKIAKSKLKPHDLKQKGQSRLFYYDQYWFTILVEFQPSSFDKGTYLNIGVDFNFYPREHFAFSLIEAEKEFIPYNNDEQFSKAIEELCHIVIKKVDQLKMRLKDFSSAGTTLINDLKAKDSWDNLDIAFVSALNNQATIALNYLNKVLTDTCTHDWELQRREFVLRVIEWLKQSNFDTQIQKQIKQTRKLKKLDT